MKQMIYIHVPFCRHKCAYCDFVSGTNIGLKERYIEAVGREMEVRGCGGEADTLYMGGGTPSMLSVEDIVWLRGIVEERYDLSGLKEWTVECNPEDMSIGWLEGLREAGVNRLSVGVQSLDDGELRWMERRHSGEEALEAVRRAQKVGFENISCDVIFGVPEGGCPRSHHVMTFFYKPQITQINTDFSLVCESINYTDLRLMDIRRLHRLKHQQAIKNEFSDRLGGGLERTLEGIIGLGVQHVSAYSLMMEEGSKITKKGIRGVDEEVSAGMYRRITERLREAGFGHYEISNWALPGFESRHNSGYWSSRSYVGLGPGAHSYDGVAERRWNVGNTLKYCNMIERGEEFWEIERLTEEDRFNEMVMLGLRRREGVDLEVMRERFGEGRVGEFLRAMGRFEGLVEVRDGRCSLTEEGVYVSDMVMAEGFVVDGG